MFALFLACIAGPWAWFNLSWLKVGRSTLNVESSTLNGGSSFTLLAPLPSVPGYRFVPARLDDSVYAMLGTTNIVNGTFVPLKRPEAGSQGLAANNVAAESAITNRQSAFPPSPVHVFLASWPPSRRSKAVGLLHTPDVCWRLAGWSTVSAGQPRSGSLRFAGRQLPMQSRVFADPNGAGRKFVLWCQLVDGQPLDSLSPVAAGFNLRSSSPTARRPASAPLRLGGKPAEPPNHRNTEPPKLRPSPSPTRLGRLREDLASRWIVARNFWQLVKRRTAGFGSKQFLRVSVPVTTDWQTARDQLDAFVPRWLEPVKSAI